MDHFCTFLNSLVMPLLPLTIFKGITTGNIVSLFYIIVKSQFRAKRVTNPCTVFLELPLGNTLIVLDFDYPNIC